MKELIKAAIGYTLLILGIGLIGSLSPVLLLFLAGAFMGVYIYWVFSEANRRDK